MNIKTEYLEEAKAKPDFSIDKIELFKNYKTIKITFQNKVLTCQINRPKHLNAINSSVLKELHSFFDELYQFLPTQKIAGLIMTGAGEKAFIAGADIEEMSNFSANKAMTFGALGQDVTLKMERLPLPIIACVSGFALGGGLELAMASDFIYATKDSMFGQPEVKLGLIPGFGGTQRLPVYIGRARAKEYIYTGKMFSANDAFNFSLVNQLFLNKDEMLEFASKSLKTISNQAMDAISNAKNAINNGEKDNIHFGLKQELSYFEKCFNSQNSKIGMQAFIKKEKPVFV